MNLIKLFFKLTIFYFYALFIPKCILNKIESYNFDTVFLDIKN